MRYFRPALAVLLFTAALRTGSAQTSTSSGMLAVIPAAWSATTTYAQYSFVIGSDGNTYVSTEANNVGNNPTAAGSTAWAKFAGGGGASEGSTGTLQAAGQNGGFVAATPSSVFAAEGYTPLNPSKDLLDVSNAAAALANLGGASSASVAASAAVAASALAQAQNAIPIGPVSQYSSSTAYGKGALVRDGSGYRFLSLVAGNIGNTPSEAGDTNYWAILSAASGAAASAGAATDLQLSSGPGGSLTADDTAQIFGDHSLHTLGPRIDVRDSIFASGWTLNGKTAASCQGVDGNTSGLADPTGANNSECALRSALDYAYAYESVSSVWPSLYLPAGIYKVQVSGYSAVLNFVGGSIGIQGDGPNSSVIKNVSPEAAAIAYSSAGPYLSALGITTDGGSETGDGIDIENSQDASLHHFSITNVGGHGINMQGSSERARIEDFSINSTRFPILLNGGTNEDYIGNCDLAFNGYTSQTNYWNVNSINGIQGTLSAGPWVPDPHVNVYMAGDNDHFYNCSVKGTLLGGVRLALTTSSMHHVYTEADSSGTHSSGSPTFEIAGKQELGQLTGNITATALSIPVDDAEWQPCYWPDPSDTTIACQNQAASGMYIIFPRDYLAGSTAASAAAPGVLRGQYELIAIASFSADGKANLASRSGTSNPAGPSGAAGPIASFAWPIGSVIEQILSAGYGQDVVTENHINMVHTGPIAMTCSDTALQPSVAFIPEPGFLGSGYNTGDVVSVQQNGAVVGTATVTASGGQVQSLNLLASTTYLLGSGLTTADSGSGTGLRVNAVSGWHSNPSEMCGEGFVGWVPDGYAVSPANKGQMPPQVTLFYAHNSVYTGAVNGSNTLEQFGQGHVKANNAMLTLGGEDGPLAGPQPIDTAFTTYYNGSNWIDIYGQGGNLYDPGVAQIYFDGAAAPGAFSSAWFKYLDTGGGTAIATQYVSNGKDQCQYSGAASSTSTQPLYGLCFGSGGIYAKVWNASASQWVTQWSTNQSGTTFPSSPTFTQGVSEPADSYSTQATMTQGSGSVTTNYQPSGSGTYNLETPVEGHSFSGLFIVNRNNTITFKQSAGGAYLNNTPLGSSGLAITNYAGMVNWVTGQGGNVNGYINTNPFPAKVAPGAGLGHGASCSLSNTSTISTAVVTCTVAETGTPSTAATIEPLFTLSTVNGIVMGIVPKACFASAANLAASTQMGISGTMPVNDLWFSPPTSTGVVVETGSVAWTPGTYSINISCPLQ